MTGGSAFRSPSRTLKTKVIRNAPPERHLRGYVTGGLSQLLDQCRKGSVVHDFSNYTTKDGAFRPQSGMPMLASRYRYVCMLGKGQSSVFFKAEDTFSNNRQVAIKVLHTHYNMLGAQETDCIRRLNLADPSNSSGTLRLETTFRVGEHYCMVFELLHPKSVGDFFRKLPRNEVIPHIRQAATRLLFSLGFLQQQNVIHADLKPENTLLAKAGDLGTLKVVDFGNAIHCVHEELSLYYDDFELQTLLYRAPEVMFGLLFGLEIDMWSLGCVLAEFYIGRPIFDGQDKDGVLAKMVSILGPVPEDLCRKGKFFPDLRHLTAKNPRKTSTFEFMEKIHCCDAIFCDFLLQLLQYNPGDRLSVPEAMCHPFLASQIPAAYILPANNRYSHIASEKPPGYPCVLNERQYLYRPSVAKNVQQYHMSPAQLLSHGTTLSTITYRKVAQVQPQARNPSISQHKSAVNQRGGSSKTLYQSIPKNRLNNNDSKLSYTSNTNGLGYMLKVPTFPSQDPSKSLNDVHKIVKPRLVDFFTYKNHLNSIKEEEKKPSITHLNEECNSYQDGILNLSSKVVAKNHQIPSVQSRMDVKPVSGACNTGGAVKNQQMTVPAYQYVNQPQNDIKPVIFGQQFSNQSEVDVPCNYFSKPGSLADSRSLSPWGSPPHQLGTNYGQDSQFSPSFNNGSICNGTPKQRNEDLPFREPTPNREIVAMNKSGELRLIMSHEVDESLKASESQMRSSGYRNEIPNYPKKSSNRHSLQSEFSKNGVMVHQLKTISTNNHQDQLQTSNGSRGSGQRQGLINRPHALPLSSSWSSGTPGKHEFRSRHSSLGLSNLYSPNDLSSPEKDHEKFHPLKKRICQKFSMTPEEEKPVISLFRSISMPVNSKVGAPPVVSPDSSCVYQASPRMKSEPGDVGIKDRLTVSPDSSSNPVDTSASDQNSNNSFGSAYTRLSNISPTDCEDMFQNSACMLNEHTKANQRLAGDANNNSFEENYLHAAKKRKLVKNKKLAPGQVVLHNEGMNISSNVDQLCDNAMVDVSKPRRNWRSNTLDTASVSKVANQSTNGVADSKKVSDRTIQRKRHIYNELDGSGIHLNRRVQPKKNAQCSESQSRGRSRNAKNKSIHKSQGDEILYSNNVNDIKSDQSVNSDIHAKRRSVAHTSLQDPKMKTFNAIPDHYNHKFKPTGTSISLNDDRKPPRLLAEKGKDESNSDEFRDTNSRTRPPKQIRQSRRKRGGDRGNVDMNETYCVDKGASRLHKLHESMNADVRRSQRRRNIPFPEWASSSESEYSDGEITVPARSSSREDIRSSPSSEDNLILF